MQFTINGSSHSVDCDVRTSLLDLLREHLGTHEFITSITAACDCAAET